MVMPNYTKLSAVALVAFATGAFVAHAAPPDAKPEQAMRTARVESTSVHTAPPTLYFLALRGGVMSVSAHGDKRAVVVPLDQAGNGPDGIALDAKAGHLYWTNMGKVSENDGSIVRSDLDGGNVKVIVPVGGTFTPKQLKLDADNRKLYWSDREGMRVMRANLDGSNIETLIVTGSGDADRKDAARWCVGIAIDTHGGKLYWTQKGGDNANKGTIKRANLNMPAGATASTRKDIETLFSNLPEPIDLDIDFDTRLLYWTDRGDNTISRAPLDPPAKFDAAKRTDREILLRNVGEAIGVALDVRGDRLYYTSLGGVVGTVGLDGTNAKTLLSDQGALTGIVALER
jgi:DNA-binding beta-propeller fold protein YncE